MNSSRPSYWKPGIKKTTRTTNRCSSSIINILHLEETRTTLSYGLSYASLKMVKSRPYQMPLTCPSRLLMISYHNFWQARLETINFSFSCGELDILHHSALTNFVYSIQHFIFLKLFGAICLLYSLPTKSLLTARHLRNMAYFLLRLMRCTLLKVISVFLAVNRRVLARQVRDCCNT